MSLFLSEGMSKGRSAKTGLQHNGRPVKDFQAIYDLSAGKHSGS